MASKALFLVLVLMVSIQTANAVDSDAVRKHGIVVDLVTHELKISPVLDLRRFKKHITSAIDNSLKQFVKAHPTENVSSVLFSLDAVNGEIGIGIDTRENSDAMVKKYQFKPAFYEKDASGAFNDSQPDCKYVWDTIICKEWRDYYWGKEGKGANNLVVYNHVGKYRSISKYDDDYNKPFFDFMVHVLRQYFMNNNALPKLREKVFRVGVYYGNYRDFWRVK